MIDETDPDTIAVRVDEIAKVEKLVTLLKQMGDLRVQAFSDVLLNVHFLLHQERGEEAMLLLCTTAAMLEGHIPPDEVGVQYVAKLNEVNLERAKFYCEGTA
jgi:hypothetical protein